MNKMQTRAKIIVKGEVQRVGYRDAAETIARKMDKIGEKIDAGRAENREGFGMLGEKIDGIKEDTGEIKDTLSFLKEVHRETLELKAKYDVLSRDVAEIKIKVNAG